jgi:hypothetical protein
LNCINHVCLLINKTLLQFYTVVSIVCVSGFKIIMYKEHYILLQIGKEKYAIICNHACIKFNFIVLFVKCFVLFLKNSIFEMLMVHYVLFQLFNCESQFLYMLLFSCKHNICCISSLAKVKSILVSYVFTKTSLVAFSHALCRFHECYVKSQQTNNTQKKYTSR